MQKKPPPKHLSHVWTFKQGGNLDTESFPSSFFFEVKSYHIHRNEHMKYFLLFYIINLYIINCKDQEHSLHTYNIFLQTMHINQNSCTDILGVGTK